MLEYKLGINSLVELVNKEERVAKLKTLELFDANKINGFEIGTFNDLASIHEYLFKDIKENIIKKYVEMNIAYPFREDNGKSTRI